MTHEEKLQEAKRLYETANSDQRYVLESLYPELIKSEDERTRKEIIDFATKANNGVTSILANNYNFNKWIAWLEKQVHVDEDEIVKGIRRGVAISLINYIDANSKGMCLSNMECEGIENAIVNEDWDKVYSYMKKKFEKQGEQKVPVAEFKAKDWYVSKVDGKIYNAKFMEKTPTNQARRLEIEKAAMSATGIIEQEEWFIKGAEWSDKNPSYISSEKQGEQNPGDKVEPKFHEREWIVQGYNILKIKCVGDTYYCFETVGGYVDDMLVSEIDSQFHLWTIQDAKDGDVLVSGQIIILFKNFEEDSCYNFVIAHAGIDISGKLQITNKHWLISNEAKPATKEQREQLKKAMADAGYTFDFEKKELKKIEKSAWSEEDEMMLRYAVDFVSTSPHSYAGDIFRDEIGKDEVINWLKSLKDRYTWKPSDEQIKVCKEVYADILSAKGFDLGTVNSELNRLEEQLKTRSYGSKYTIR